MRRFSTILVAALPVLALAGCSLVPAGQSTQVTAPTVPEPEIRTQTTSEGEVPDKDTTSSEMGTVTATATVTWENNLPRLSTGEIIGGGLEISAPSANGLVIALDEHEDMTTRLLLDQSVAVLIDDTFVLGISMPRSPGAPVNAWTWERVDHTDQIVFTATRRSNLEEDTELSAFLGETAVESARWVDEREGPRLFITPSNWARDGGLAVSDYGWHSVVRDVPEVTEHPGESLEHQFQCHAIGAQSKDTRNLETWYDDIGLLSLLAARCNP
jgi:hypothetical protein